MPAVLGSDVADYAHIVVAAAEEGGVVVVGDGVDYACHCCCWTPQQHAAGALHALPCIYARP